MTPPSGGRAARHQMLCQLMIFVNIHVVFNLLSNNLEMSLSNSLHLYELYAALVISILFAAILLFWILSSASAAAAVAASGERASDFVVHWVHVTACSSFFVTFMLRFYFQVLTNSFIRSCLIFAGILALLVGPSLLLINYPNFFKLCFQRLRAKIIRESLLPTLQTLLFNQSSDVYKERLFISKILSKYRYMIGPFSFLLLVYGKTFPEAGERLVFLSFLILISSIFVSFFLYLFSFSLSLVLLSLSLSLSLSPYLSISLNLLFLSCFVIVMPSSSPSFYLARSLLSCLSFSISWREFFV